MSIIPQYDYHLKGRNDTGMERLPDETGGDGPRAREEGLDLEKEKQRDLSLK